MVMSGEKAEGRTVRSAVSGDLPLRLDCCADTESSTLHNAGTVPYRLARLVRSLSSQVSTTISRTSLAIQIEFGSSSD